MSGRAYGIALSSGHRPTDKSPEGSAVPHATMRFLASYLVRHSTPRRAKPTDRPPREALRRAAHAVAARGLGRRTWRCPRRASPLCALRTTRSATSPRRSLNTGPSIILGQAAPAVAPAKSDRCDQSSWRAGPAGERRSTLGCEVDHRRARCSGKHLLPARATGMPSCACKRSGFVVGATAQKTPWTTGEVIAHQR